MKAERLAITLDESGLHLESVNREMTSLRDINTQLQVGRHTHLMKVCAINM